MKKFVAEIDPDEMALRIAESCIGAKRVGNCPAAEILADLRQTEPAMVAGFYRAALAAVKYLEESINNRAKVH